VFGFVDDVFGGEFEDEFVGIVDDFSSFWEED